MPTIESLYAWAAPAFLDESPVDHTWVTSYDNRTQNYPDIEAVIAAEQDCWFCWGGYCAKGGTSDDASGFLCLRDGDLVLSRCLARPNADCGSSFPARGTIFTYGVDGVCHQLANQVLYSTGGGGGQPVTVAPARGYMLSCAIYGTYGLQRAAWKGRIEACSTTIASLYTRRRAKGEMMMSATLPAAPHDEFEEHVNKVLGPGAEAAKLLLLRGEFQKKAAMQAHEARTPPADELNERNQRFFDEAAKILPPKDYVRVFGVKPGARIKLVRADIMK